MFRLHKRDRQSVLGTQIKKKKHTQIKHSVQERNSAEFGRGTRIKLLALCQH